jgi:hypothetical protein
MTVETIHIYLPEEAVDCWYPARAEHLGGDRYRILDEAPADPMWEFSKGDIVRCRAQKLGPGTAIEEPPVAFERAEFSH